MPPAVHPSAAPAHVRGARRVPLVLLLRVGQRAGPARGSTAVCAQAVVPLPTGLLCVCVTGSSPPPGSSVWGCPGPAHQPLAALHPCTAASPLLFCAW